MKSDNFFNVVVVLLSVSGCSARPDYRLNPSNSTEWVLFSVKLPAQTEVIPMNVLYRSATCQHKDYDSTTESHVRQVRGFNPQVLTMIPVGGNNLWQGRIAIDGGGRCHWELSSVRIGIKLLNSNSLTQGRENIAINYVFDFDDQGYSGGFGVGLAKNVYGDIYLRTRLFPMVVINHMFNDSTVEMFAGDTSIEKWSRHYRVYKPKKITIDPVLYHKRIVHLETPKSKSDPAGMTITYPDGQVVRERKLDPDYEKLLMMK